MAVQRDDLRPKNLEDYIGQEQIKDLLWTSIQSSKQRNQPLDHILLNGPPGLGKTTLAMIISYELGWGIKTIIAPSLGSPRAAARLIMNHQPRTILFIDEIHRVRKPVQEVLYPVLEDNKLYSTIAANVELDIPPLTVIGATTNIGKLEQPFIDRFGLQFQLVYYTIDELSSIIINSGTKLGLPDLDWPVVDVIAQVARGTPRIANTYLKRIRDYSLVSQQPITVEFATNILRTKLHISELGLRPLDRRYLRALLNLEHPLGVEALASKLNEDTETIQDFVEPYLMQLGLVERRLNGRWITSKGTEYLSHVLPKKSTS